MIAEHKTTKPLTKNGWLLASILVFVIVWISTLVGTTDMNNWLLENALTFTALLFLVITYKWHRFSNASYVLISLYLCLHVYGSKYTYAENPVGYWLQDLFDLSRNHYDRVVHFSFGLLLTYPMLEIFINWLGYPPKTARFAPIVVTLAISAVYELIEWAVADIFFTEQGQAYLGTQGDIWDAQKDTFLAFLGATIATTILLFTPKAWFSWQNK